MMGENEYLSEENSNEDKDKVTWREFSSVKLSFDINIV